MSSIVRLCGRPTPLPKYAVRAVKGDHLDMAELWFPVPTLAGDVVLLSPACSSFDQFENYEHRGRVFRQLVDELI